MADEEKKVHLDENGQPLSKNALKKKLKAEKAAKAKAEKAAKAAANQPKKKEKEAARLRSEFAGATPQESREKLMPFFWTQLMQEHGAVVGNRWKGSEMKLTNRHRFSYPGYSEILVGFAADEKITSNEAIPNPNQTVLQFFQDRFNLSYDQCAVFGCWNVITAIASSEPNSFLCNSGYQAYVSPDPIVRLLSQAQFETKSPWDSVRHDYYTFRFAMDHLQRKRPKVLYLSLGETDDWSHDLRYDRVLQAIHQTDRYLEELWGYLQQDPHYKNKTTLVVATDHGRGTNAFNWGSHNARIDGAQFVWMAVAGPEISLRGELLDQETVYQNQIAATLCLALGIDSKEFSEKAGEPVRSLLR